MSNLSELLPAGAGAKSADFVASGTLGSGVTVVLKTDGTVEAVAGVDELLGSSTQVYTGNFAYPVAVYDTVNNKVVCVFSGASNRPYAVVGTVSGTSISFGTSVVAVFVTGYYLAAAFDQNTGKILLCYADYDNSEYGKAVVGTVSGTSISFGSVSTFNSGSTSYISAIYDSSAQKVVIGYKDGSFPANGSLIAATISGTSVSFGSESTFNSGSAQFISLSYDAPQNKTLIFYQDQGNSRYPTCRVATLSGTSFTYGSETVLASRATENHGSAYTTNGKHFLVYRNDGSPNNLSSVVIATVSGDAVSFGAEVATTVRFSTAPYVPVVYDSSADKVVVFGRNQDNSYYSTYLVASISGTVITLGSPVVVQSVASYEQAAGYDPDEAKSVLFWPTSSRNIPVGAVLRAASTNATDFIGITDQAIADTATGAVIVQGGVITNSNLFPLAYTGSVGSEVVFEAARADHSMPIFDSSNNKVVIIYADNGDSSHGKAIVGTVSGSSISYGTAVTFNAATTTRISGTFDSNSNKVVIAFGDDGDSSKVKSIVGTVSGTSISFGSEATITTNTTGVSTTTTFDSNSNKVVVFYRDDGNSEYGTAAVGTVSGTSISFGTPVVFESAGTGILQSSSTFDTSANKTVVAYRDIGNSSNGTAIVGTVSGTSISFGTAVVFHAASTEETLCAFDSVNNKVVIAYRDNAAPKALASRVGTISGASISFGTEATVQSITSYIGYPAMSYSPDSQRVVIVYTNADNSSYGTYALGSVSGTDITYDTPVVFAAASTEDCGIAYDTNADKFVVSFKDTANSNHGTSVVLTLTGTVPALTIGTDYYVQDDGTLSTTVSSVPAGRALSTTSILLEG